MNSPVAFFVYRRPEQTRRVFKAIAAARPPHLLVVADGPRSEDERAACLAARAVLDEVDWPCRVERHFADTNLGCRRRVSSGLDWVFSRVEEAIILEDDCLPHPDFFPFCETLLARYRDDPRILHIAGTDPNPGPPRGEASYYGSRYPSIWGWATWRRAWRGYDVNLDAWPALKAAQGHLAWFDAPEEAAHFGAVWDEIRNGTLDTWDAQWLFHCRRSGGLALVPNGNMVTNIGFQDDATHTRDRRHPFAHLPARPPAFPLRHPAELVADAAADRQRAAAEFLRRPPVWQRCLGRVRNRHWYGSLIRRLPVIGPAWAVWRTQRSRKVP